MSPQQPMENTVFGHHKKSGKPVSYSSYKNLPGKLVHVFFFLPSCLHFFPLRSPYQGQLHWNQLPPETELWSNLEPRFRGKNGGVFLMSFLGWIFHLSHTIHMVYWYKFAYIYHQHINQTQVNIPIYTIHGMSIDIQLWYFLSVCFHVANNGRMYLNWRPTSKQ